MSRTVVVTGASAGIGRACAVAFARDGWDVALLARGEDRLESARREVEACGQRALAVPVDVADAAAVDAAADRVVREWERIDAWVNCAMVTVYGRVHDVTAAEVRRVTEVTYLGSVNGTLTALAHMRRQGAGTIVQVGSALAYRSIPLQSAYCGAKAALRAFTDSLRSELIGERSAVRVSMVHLPAVNTPQFDWARNHLDRRPQPVPPIYQPEAIARAIVCAAHEAPREFWVAPSTAKAILGTAVAPGLLDRYLATHAAENQQADAEAIPDREDNLERAPPGDPGARGRFDSRATDEVRVLDASVVRGVLGIGVAASACLVALASYASGRAHERRQAPRGLRGLLAGQARSSGRRSRLQSRPWTRPLSSRP